MAFIAAPISNVTSPIIVTPLPNAPVAADAWIMLPTDPPQIMRRSEYERLLREATHG